MSIIAVYWLEWLEDTPLSEVIRTSAWLYPGIEIFHILGIVLLVGPALMFDLRLLGFSKTLPVKALAKHLLPWSRKGLFLAIATGALLFISNAKSLGHDPVFRIKMVLIILGGLNAMVFHKYILASMPKQGDDPDIFFHAKISAIISITLWIATISCGRLLAY